MKVAVKKLPQSEIELLIEVSEEDLKKYRDQTVKELASEVKIPGFRSGYIPENILEQHLGAETLQAKTLEKALPLSYAQAVTNEKLQVVSRPKIKVISEKPLKYEARVAILPEVKIEGYEKIKIKKEEAKVTEKEIEEVEAQIRKDHATFKEVDLPAKKGDRVEIDFEGFDEEGKILENTQSKNHPVVIGEGTLVKDFEEKLIGLKRSEEKEFEIAFPSDYHYEKFRGRKIKFRVKINQVQEVVLPEFSSELIEKILGKKQSVEEFKKLIQKDLQDQKEKEIRAKREDEFLKELLKLAKVEVPEALIEEEIDFILRRIKMDFERKGLKFEDYLEHLKKKGKDLKGKYREQAEKQVILRLVLNHIFQKDKIEVGEEELEKEIREIVSYYPEKEQAKVRDLYREGKTPQGQLKNSLLLKKFFNQYLG